MSEYGSVNLEKLRRSKLPEEPKPEPKEQEKIGVFRGEELEPEQPVVQEPPEKEKPKDTPEVERLKETVDEQLADFEKKPGKGKEKPKEVKAKEAEPQKPIDKLGEARKKYVKSQKELNERSGLFSDTLTGQALAKLRGKKSKAKVLEESRKGKEEYEKERGPLDSVEKFLEERTKLVEEQMAVYAEKSKFNVLGRGYDAYKTLGQYNLGWGMEKLGLGTAAEKIEKVKGGKILTRGLNVRTVTSLGLLGVGVGLGAGTAVGAGAILLRRAMAGAGTTIGTYDLLNLGAEKLVRSALEKQVKKIDTYEEGSDRWRYEVAFILAEVESRAILDGKNLADLKNDQPYNSLIAKYKKVIEERAAISDSEGLDPEYKLDVIKNRLEAENQSLDYKLKHLLRWGKEDRFMRKLGIGMAAGVAGLLVGSGAFAKLFRNKTDWQEGWNQFKGMFGGSPVAEQVVEQPVPGGAAATAPHMETVVKVTEQPVAGTPVETPAPTAGPAPVQEVTPPQATVPPVETTPSQSPPISVVEGPSTPPVELRAGAAYEVRPDGEVILHAGQRGIEGAILDYAKAINTKDPEAYRTLLKSLAKYSSPAYDLTDDPERLGKAVHRFVLAYAKQHDLDPTKLDRILAADVRLKDIIELDKESVKYFEKAAGAVSENVAESAPVPVADINADVSAAVEAAVSDLTPTLVSETTAAELAELANQKSLKASEVVRQVTGTAETGGGARLPEPLPPAPPPSESGEHATAAAESADKAFEAALDMPVDEFSKFLELDFGLTLEDFKAVQDYGLEEFLSMYQTGSSEFKARYTKLYTELDDLFKQNAEESIEDQAILKKTSVLDIMVPIIQRNRTII